MIKKSNYISPIYNTINSIDCWDIVAQKVNPNSINSKAFGALQVSILNNGYIFPIVVSSNKLYSKDDLKLYLNKNNNKNKLKLLINSNDNKSFSSESTKFSTEISSDEIRKLFKYSVIDGQQRSSIIRLGTYYFLNMKESNQINYSNYWVNGKNIPNEPGKELLMYLAWRENFKLPCLILENDNSEAENLSITILLNQARGTHRFESMKQIVYDLINKAQMDPKWIAKNLFLDIDSVNRIIQLNGIKSAYEDIENCDLSWNPEDSYSYKQKEKYYLNREAKAWMDNNNIDYSNIKDYEEYYTYADKFGWNYEFHKNAVRQRDIKLAPNGTRAGRNEGRIINGFIPK